MESRKRLLLRMYLADTALNTIESILISPKIIFLSKNKFDLYCRKCKPHYTHDENYPTIGKTYDSIDLEAYGKGIHLLIENKEMMIWGGNAW